MRGGPTTARLAAATLVLVAAATWYAAARATRFAMIGPGAGQGQPGMPEPLAFGDRTGFQSIFDGSSLKDWDGDPTAWRVENGALVGESSAERPLKANTFVVWRGGRPADFELKLEYRMNATNSGIQYRSVELPEMGKWVLKGYQADIDFDSQWTGQLYEERGRGFLALRGQTTHIADGQKPRVIGTLENADALKAVIKPTEWNQVHIIARGHTLVHIINGHVMSVAIDDDMKQRATNGLIGFQMHTGPPMKVEFRNIWLKTL
jgi:3-keto-disaccharide hydrolase